MTHQTDSELILAVVKGNTAAFADLVKRYQGMAFQIAFKLLQHREDAEEVTQDAFLKVFNALDSFKGEAKFSTWLYRIVYTTAISRTRKKKLPVQSLATTEEYDTRWIADDRSQIQKLTDTDQQNILQSAMQCLYPEEQVLVTLFYQQDYSVEEISVVTSLTKANIKVKLMRSRHKLYAALHKQLKHEITEIL